MTCRSPGLKDYLIILGLEDECNDGAAKYPISLPKKSSNQPQEIKKVVKKKRFFGRRRSSDKKGPKRSKRLESRSRRQLKKCDETLSATTHSVDSKSGNVKVILGFKNSFENSSIEAGEGVNSSKNEEKTEMAGNNNIVECNKNSFLSAYYRFIAGEDNDDAKGGSNNPGIDEEKKSEDEGANNEKSKIIVSVEDDTSKDRQKRFKRFLFRYRRQLKKSDGTLPPTADVLVKENGEVKEIVGDNNVVEEGINSSTVEKGNMLAGINTEIEQKDNYFLAAYNRLMGVASSDHSNIGNDVFESIVDDESNTVHEENKADNGRGKSADADSVMAKMVDDKNIEVEKSDNSVSSDVQVKRSELRKELRQIRRKKRAKYHQSVMERKLKVHKGKTRLAVLRQRKKARSIDPAISEEYLDRYWPLSDNEDEIIPEMIGKNVVRKENNSILSPISDSGEDEDDSHEDGLLQLSSREGDDTVTIDEDDHTLSSHEDDHTLSSHEDDHTLSSHEDDHTLSSHEDKESISIYEDEETVSTLGDGESYHNFDDPVTSITFKLKKLRKVLESF